MIGDWWVTDHRSRSYDLREEIRNQGGRWMPEMNAWKLVGKENSSDAISVLKSAGLALEFIPGSERKYQQRSICGAKG